MAAVSTSQVAGRSALAQSARALRPIPTSRVFGVSPVSLRLPSVRCSAQAQHSAENLQEQITRAAAWSTAAATLLAAGNAQAANEVATLAAGDNRFGTLTLLALPALGWVAFNIGGPALNQLNNMKTKTRGAAVGVGLGAALLLASQKADAAQEVAQLAAGDNRFAIIATLFLPVIGWVLFNIGGPALNQLNNVAQKRKTGVVKKVASKVGKKRAVTGAIVGLSAASLLAAPQADAANEVMQLATGDNRFGIIATLFLPVLGWVLFNIGGPALNQLNNTGVNKGKLKKAK
ncbi:probable photosystem II core complex proteins psbY, chloroplastic [Coccomyxa sp. Obi]|nr:probable photosystem II core complex proteins psbY, chloroplastic [Coccomyxa sp. Obi]